MKVLVLGANGATGNNVVTQLAKQGINVRALVRDVEKFKLVSKNDHIEIEKASILDVDVQKLKQYLTDVDAVISCLGHNISLKGILGKPYTLVVDAIKRVVASINELGDDKIRKLVLMNTTACINKSQNEKYVKGEKVVMGIMSALLPPQRDNEYALEYLINDIGKDNDRIEWIAIRPDSLINENEVTEYEVYPSTIRSPVFNAGKTSRINVADFMVKLLQDEELWARWKYKTPVIYNKKDNRDKTQA